jgi:cystathionine gamma-synthase
VGAVTDAHHTLPHGLSSRTRVVATGRPARSPDAAVNPPIVLSSTYAAGGPMVYGRTGNPVWTAFEEVLGSLEGGDALVFASGMSAIAAVLSLVPREGVVVVPRHAYNTTLDLVDSMGAEGLTVRRVDLTDTLAVHTACHGADLLWLESPTNPMLEVCDVAALATAARALGVLTVCDNTFATPVLQQPLSLGVDVVVHSVTKYLAGHSDVVLGAVVTAPTEGGRALAERIETHRRRYGAIAGPVETWLALRGIRTLHLRVDRAGATAADLAGRLAGHPCISRVRYPGFGAMVAVEVVGDADAADAVAAATRLWLDATSLGGVESTLERRRKWALEPETVPESLLRLSVGIEDVEDLWADLDQALRGGRA